MNNTDSSIVEFQNGSELITITDELLAVTQEKFTHNKTIRVPISQLSMLGGAVASLQPAFNEMSVTTTFNTTGVYKLANAVTGDALKVAKNGDYWGAMKTATGKSKMARLSDAGPMSATTKMVAPINPLLISMSITLYSIEQQIISIEKMTEEILTYLEIEKESEIEADLEMLMDLVKKFKLNWDNQQYVNSNHKLVLDIERTARKNINAYKKQIEDILNSNNLIVFQSDANSTASKLSKKFMYYRLSIYTYTFASFMEIMLGHNFEENYIRDIQNQVRDMSHVYRDIFTRSSCFIEKTSKSSIQTNVQKGFGGFTKMFGDIVGSIPLVNEGPVDEFLKDSGKQIESDAKKMEQKALQEFATLSNPNIDVFLAKMDDVIQIYNHNSELYFDKEDIYLVSNNIKDEQ